MAYQLALAGPISFADRDEIDVPQDLCEVFNDDKNSDFVFYKDDGLDADIQEILNSPDEPMFPKGPKPKQKYDIKDWSGLNSYYAKISRIAPLSRQEEEQIFERYSKIRKVMRRLQELDPNLVPLNKQLLATRNEIVERNCRFVVKLARAFWMDGNLENFENLISAGNIGLIRAVDKFDHKRGTRFLSYAAHWVALEVRNEIANATLVVVPVWWQKTLRKLADAHKELTKNLSDPPAVTLEDISKKTNIPLRLVAKSERSKRLHINNAPYSQVDISSTHHDLIKTQACDNLVISRDSVEHECFSKIAREKLDGMLTEISGKLTRGRTHSPSKFNAADAVRFVYGLSDLGPQNLRQISNVTSVCSERVRQLKEEGLKQLRKKMRQKGIKCVSDLL